MDYHIARNNQKLGVYPQNEAQTRFQSGEILPSDLVWCEGMSGWRPAAEVFGTPAAPTPVAMPPPVAPAMPGGFPPPSTPVTPPPAKPANYLIWAILVTLFCCLPFGIVSIIFASQVDTKYAAGDYAGAEQSSGRAKLWMWIGAGVGIVGFVAYVGLMFVGLAAGSFPH